MNQEVHKAIAENEFVHKYIIAASHAFLWIAALSFAGFAHTSSWFTHDEALLLSTLFAYCAYLCESGLVTWRVAAANANQYIDFKKGSLYKWVMVNAAINIVFAILFLHYHSWIFIVAIIFTAAWQKYMDGRIPPRLQATMRPLAGNTFKARTL